MLESEIVKTTDTEETKGRIAKGSIRRLLPPYLVDETKQALDESQRHSLVEYIGKAEKSKGLSIKEDR